MNEETLPDGVRRVPGPAVRWSIQLGPYLYDGYVFEDDPSDLARFMRWAAEKPHGSLGPARLILNRIIR